MVIIVVVGLTGEEVVSVLGGERHPMSEVPVVDRRCHCGRNPVTKRTQATSSIEATAVRRFCKLASNLFYMTCGTQIVGLMDDTSSTYL